MSSVQSPRRLFFHCDVGGGRFTCDFWGPLNSDHSDPLKENSLSRYRSPWILDVCSTDQFLLIIFSDLKDHRAENQQVLSPKLMLCRLMFSFSKISKVIFEKGNRKSPTKPLVFGVVGFRKWAVQVLVLPVENGLKSLSSSCLYMLVVTETNDVCCWIDA